MATASGVSVSKSNPGQAAVGRTAGGGALGPAPSTNTGASVDPLTQLAQMRQNLTPQSTVTTGLGSTPSGVQNNYQPVSPTWNGASYGAVAAPVSATMALHSGGNVNSWIQQAMQDTGVNGLAWAMGLAEIAQHESSDNPNAVNNWDSNAKAGTPSTGIMQTIGPTFNAYAPASLRGAGMTNPVADIAAAIEYINSRYGGINNVPGVKALAAGQPYVGY